MTSGDFEFNQIMNFNNILIVFICRPTASQLLKDPFFKKAKTKENLVEVLSTAPSLKERARKVSDIFSHT